MKKEIQIETVYPEEVHCSIHNHEWVVGFNRCLIGMERNETCEES